MPPFTFNCDIPTAMVRGDDAVFAFDLWLDVLVRADGITHSVYDQDEFAAALAHGWLSDRESRQAEDGRLRLVDLIEARSLVEFLADVYPFAPITAPRAPDMKHVPLTEVGSFLQPVLRSSW